MATLRIASSSLQSAILFAEHKDVVSAYPADFKPSHNLSALLTKSCSFSFSLSNALEVFAFENLLSAVTDQQA